MAALQGKRTGKLSCTFPTPETGPNQMQRASVLSSPDLPGPERPWGEPRGRRETSGSWQAQNGALLSHRKHEVKVYTQISSTASLQLTPADGREVALAERVGSCLLRVVLQREKNPFESWFGALQLNYSNRWCVNDAVKRSGCMHTETQCGK